MTGWEQPRKSRTRRAAITAFALMGIIAIAWSAWPSEPGTQMRVTREDTARATVEQRTAAVWPQPVPATWRRLPPSPLTPRVGASVVWTGDEVLVWGGYDSFNRPQRNGAAFDPVLGSWRPMPAGPARDASARGVRSQTQVVFVSTSQTLQYDPRSRRWRTRSPLPLPDGHRVADHVIAIDDAVVAITEPRDGQPSAVFALEADAWTRLPDMPVTLQRDHVVLGAGSRLLAIGPARDGQDTAVALDLADARATWERIDATPALPGDITSLEAAASPDGTVLLWGTRALGDGEAAAWAAVRERRGWRQVDAGPLRPTRSETVAWTGDQMLVWSRVGNVGALFDLDTDRWTAIPEPPGLDFAQNAIRTDAGLLVWGVLGSGGALYTPR